MVDWNNDGLKDLIVGEYNGKVRYYQNIGTVGNPQLHFVGYVQANGRDIDNGDYSTPFINDWNQDGYKDLLIGDSNGLFYLYLSSGENPTPILTNYTNIMVSSGAQADVGYRSGPNVVDLDDDGLKDLVSGDMTGKIYFFRNTGTNSAPILQPMVALKTGTVDILTTGTSRVTTIDWEGDGDLDMVVGNYDALLYRFDQVSTTGPTATMNVNNLGGLTIPPTGGIYRCSVQISNTSGQPVNFDVWTRIQNGNYTWTEPLVVRLNQSLGLGGSVTRNLMVQVPSTWPSGYYYYYGYLGDYESYQISSKDYGYFYKTPGDNFGGIPFFTYSDWDDEESLIAEEQIPTTARLNAASPNPFNPSTCLTFTITEPGEVYLAVYDCQGREVAVLAEGFMAAGVYERTFHAQDLGSGVYFARLQTGMEVETQKLLLVK